jgi:DNA-nicking Smr family endonuclease
MRMTVDLHGLTVYEAKLVLDRFLDRLPKGVIEVSVIHGYQSGVRLRTFVSQYEHHKVTGKIKTVNPGETIFVIKR